MNDQRTRGSDKSSARELRRPVVDVVLALILSAVGLLVVPFATNWFALIRTLFTSNQQALAEAGDTPWAILLVALIEVAVIVFLESRKPRTIAVIASALGIIFSVFFRWNLTGDAVPWVWLGAVGVAMIVSAEFITRRKNQVPSLAK